ncbi:Zn-dependent hydrolase, glyoxylase [Sphaerochaeta pleomorpha str. Grapes]|uniref:Zn-dependent hydrolase, glyoxylase n=1 Tax=Sphaerochaeta pleomorpha (strain ATCC BAA-1885 / DSM 22778 / Grapes) TaxID=158190 RepID=G8QWU0_SPHPG|nr:MBL fold metallo-hydrolase [Sphaerochaeta pleomorpha]AEV28384.1 Zn-dependent hydrolase, glyoxylase [Sphaerochaeta pleomorpha str. Grapes]
MELALIGCTFSEVIKRIVFHPDHVHRGSLKAIKHRYGHVEIIASASETAYSNGTKPTLRLVQADAFNQTLSGPSREFGGKFSAYLRTIEPCPVDTELTKEGDVAEGVRAIFTSGHTPGHISLYLEENRILLAGDALAIEDGNFVTAKPPYGTIAKKTDLRLILRFKAFRLIIVLGPWILLLRKR